MLEKSMILGSDLCTKIRNLGKRVHKRPPVIAAAPIFRVDFCTSYNIIRSSERSDSKPLLREDKSFTYSYNVAGLADSVKAGDYARDLIKNCTDALDGMGYRNVVYPDRILTDALSRTATAPDARWKIGGLMRAMWNRAASKAETASDECVYTPLLASTGCEVSPAACIVAFDGEYLRGASVGDSRFMVFKGGKYCSYVSPGASEGGAVWSGKVRVGVGDVIVIGTNGLFENLLEKEIVFLLGLTVDDFICSSAKLLANRALDNSKLKTGHHQRGDITVVVAKLVVFPSQQLYYEDDYS